MMGKTTCMAEEDDMESNKYVSMPQNDMEQLNQIAREYEQDPAKGLSHGVQKDAIQNAVGAKIGKKEPTAYKDWKVTFKLMKINEKYALSFWDEGTTGLTGDILTVEEITQRSGSRTLGPDQRLGRFLTRFESGGNTGPGSFGRGKLIFQAASNTGRIICDSLRYDDHKYIAFERKIIGTQIKQTSIPYEDRAAENFIKDATSGTLKPLTRPGTRIIILDLKDEIVNAIKISFNDPKGGDYSDSFIKMIEETWWEILYRFNAKIYLVWGERTLQARVSKELKAILEAKDGHGKWRTYTKKNFKIVIGGEQYLVKELKFVVSPQPINEDLRGVWIQRKRMKVGVMKRLEPHHSIRKKFSGYIVLGKELEDVMENAEGTTHYSYSYARKGPKHLKGYVETELERFQEKIGLHFSSGKQSEKEDMYEVLKDVNEFAPELGLITDSLSRGLKRKGVTIEIVSFNLPEENTVAVSEGDKIGPIIMKITNHKPKELNSLKIIAKATQKEFGNAKMIYSEEFRMQSNSSERFTIDAFSLSLSDFDPGVLSLDFHVIENNTNKILTHTSRTIWFEKEPPKPPKKEDSFTLEIFPPIFPHPNSRRVELEESILNIGFKVSNNTVFNIKINADLLVRRKKNPNEILQTIASERGAVLSKFSDKVYGCDSLDFRSEIYGDLESLEKIPEERECEIYFSIRAAENIPTLDLIRGDIIFKRKIPFYFEVDPPGNSVFKEPRDWAAPQDGRRSKYSGTMETGFIFYLNVEHPSFLFAKEAGEDVKRYYIREEMLKQAYVIAVEEGEFRGLAKDFEEDLKSKSLGPAEAFLKIEELIGKSLLKVG